MMMLVGNHDNGDRLPAVSCPHNYYDLSIQLGALERRAFRIFGSIHVEIFRFVHLRFWNRIDFIVRFFQEEGKSGRATQRHFHRCFTSQSMSRHTLYSPFNGSLMHLSVIGLHFRIYCFRTVDHIDAVYERPQDGNIVFFSGKKVSYFTLKES